MKAELSTYWYISLSNVLCGLHQTLTHDSTRPWVRLLTWAHRESSSLREVENTPLSSVCNSQTNPLRLTYTGQNGSPHFDLCLAGKNTMQVTLLWKVSMHKVEPSSTLFFGMNFLVNSPLLHSTLLLPSKVHK